MQTMKHDDLTYFKSLIEARLRALIEEDALGQDGQKTVELDQQSVGRLSRMDALQAQAMSQATATRRAQETVQLKRALIQIDEETYGACIDCDEPIERQRLEFNPAIQMCLSCAQG